ncbi:MAG: CPBP family glutamic-type intramembrane protease [Candidatus Acidiferrales bacterium]
METAANSSTQKRDMPIAKLVWAMSFLIITTWVINRLGAGLLLKVIRRGQINSYWPSTLVSQVFPIAMTVLLVQLIVVLYFYRPLKVFFTLPVEEESEKQPLGGFVIGIMGGVFASLASIPFLLSGNPIHIIAQELLSWPISLTLVWQVVLLLVVLPVLSELVFRGIVFRFLKGASSFWPAAIGSSLLFACVWPIPTAFVAVILGMVSALVFQKSRTLASSVLTNVTLTILVETFLLLRDSHFF